MENLMALDQVQERMERGESFVFLDVRSKSTFQNWQVKGLALQAVNVPYYDFQEDEVNDALLPERSCIVLVESDNSAARQVAKRLGDKGYEVVRLMGGSTTWHEFYLQATIAVSSAVKVLQFHRVATGCLSYLLVSGHQAIVVDPSRHIERYLQAAAREHVKITHIIDTHVHADHISGATALMRETSADYHVAHSELHAHDLPVKRLSRGTLRLGALDMRVMILDTEGETQGNSLLAFNQDFILAGNSIAVGEVGVPDLTGNAQEWAEKLWNTVLREVKNFTDDTLILPAHFAAIQALQEGGYVGARLGDIRSGAQSTSRKNVLTFATRPSDFVTVLSKASDDIKRINAGLATLDGVSAAQLEMDLRT